MPKLVYHDSSGARGTVDIGTEVVLIGRATECQIQTQDGLVSRRHARVSYDGSYWVEDLGSANGVYVGSERVQKYKLKPGDTFRCGHVEVRFEVEDMHRTAIGVSPGMVVPMPPLAVPPAIKAVPPPNAPPALSFAEAAAQQRAFTTKPAAASAVVPGAAAPPLAPPAAPGSDPPSGRSSSKTGGMAPPPAAAVMLSEAQNPGRTAETASAEVTRLRAELEVERQRRAEVERECDQAQQRASEMMRRADDAQRAIDEARRRADELQQKLEESAARVSASPSASAGDGDSERLRRRVEQLESELRRKGGGGGSAGGGGEALRAAEGERDRLRTRVAELEAQLTQAQAAQSAQAAPPAVSAEQDQELTRLRRRVEQLESDLRRARGGKPASEDGSSAKLVELEAEVRRLREEKDAVLQAQSADSKLAEELAAARRRIDQLESDARRRPMGAVSDDKRVEAQRAELESALRQLRDTERERDSLREVVARGSSTPARTPKEVSDSLTQVSDGLADVRAALRASGDELALEQLEQLRAALRKACGLLGINV